MYLSTLPSTYVARAEVFFYFSRQNVVSDLPADEVAPSTAMLNTEMGDPLVAQPDERRRR